MLRKDIVRPLADGRRHVDEQEIAKFDALAEEWWRPDGKFKLVHAFNAARVDYLVSYFEQQNAAGGIADSNKPLSGLRLLDAGCGAGIVSIPLVEAGADVTGIDASAESIKVAQREALNRGIDARFRCATPGELSVHDEKFDGAVCLEVVEHVADLEVFIDNISQHIAPGGHLVLGTLNRTVQSYLKAIVGAEYILKWLPRRTHDWSKFVTPNELKRLLAHRGLCETARQGLSFDLFRRRWHLSSDITVNYLIAFKKNASIAGSFQVIDDLRLCAPKAKNGAAWQFVADHVMGGVSRGTMVRETIAGRKALRMRGSVSLENSGGFIQVCLDLSPGGSSIDASVYSGIEIDVIGNGEAYNLHLRTADLNHPWQSYRHSFDAGTTWKTHRMPFAEFDSHRTDAPLDLTKLRRIGIVAIGRAFKADVAIDGIRFYK